jgi:hypothetical protein
LISVAAIPLARNRSRSRDKSRTSSWRLQLEGCTFPLTICTQAPPILNSTFPGKGSKSGPFPKSREYHSRDFGRSLTVISVMVSLASIVPCAKVLRHRMLRWPYNRTGTIAFVIAQEDNFSRSLLSSDRLLTPVNRSHSFPFLKRMRVGMLLTLNCWAKSLLFWVSTFAKTIRSSNLLAMSLRIGVITWQGAHQLAQKSTTTGLSLLRSSRMFPRVA